MEKKKCRNIDILKLSRQGPLPVDGTLDQPIHREEDQASRPAGLTMRLHQRVSVFIGRDRSDRRHTDYAPAVGHLIIRSLQVIACASGRSSSRTRRRRGVGVGVRRACPGHGRRRGCIGPLGCPGPVARRPEPPRRGRRAGGPDEGIPQSRLDIDRFAQRYSQVAILSHFAVLQCRFSCNFGGSVMAGGPAAAGM